MSLKPVSDLAHFNRLVQGRKSWEYMNCYLLPEVIQGYIDKNRIRFLDDQDGVLLFCEERDFYYLYFFVEDPKGIDIRFSEINLGKPIVMDLPYLGGMIPEKITAIKEFWISRGFLKHDEYRHMKRKMIDWGKDEIAFPDLPDNYSWGSAQPAIFPEIDRLLRVSLDLYSSPLPGQSEMAEMSASRQLWGLLDHEGHLVGALCTKVSGKLNTIRQLAIVPEYRGKGLADVMVKQNLAGSRGCDYFDLWVRKSNQPAIKLYEKNGYRFDGKQIVQLLKI